MELSDQDWAIPREEAVPRLLEMHGGKLFGLSSRICGDPEVARDLVQEVFLQAWRKWDQFEGRANPVVWLYTIARHSCQRMQRKRAGEPDHLDSLDEPLPFGASRIAVVANESDEQARFEQQEAAGTAIASLPMEFRMALVLKDIIGFSIAEVAEVLGVPKGTVKTRVHRARLKVRQALESGLPSAELPPPAYSRQVCMDLLQAKQEALDRGVQMPNADNIICERCNAVFATLDLATDVCGALGVDDSMPERLRVALLASMRSAL